MLGLVQSTTRCIIYKLFTRTLLLDKTSESLLPWSPLLQKSYVEKLWRTPPLPMSDETNWSLFALQLSKNPSGG